MNTQNTHEYRLVTKEERKRNIISLISSVSVLCAGLCMVLCSTVLSGQQKYIEAGITETQNSNLLGNSSANIHTATEYYVIRENDDGYISVFLSDGSLYQNWNVPAYTLPKSDRERLRIGIMAKSDAELSSYKEGFCS